MKNWIDALKWCARNPRLALAGALAGIQEAIDWQRFEADMVNAIDAPCPACGLLLEAPGFACDVCRPERNAARGCATSEDREAVARRAIDEVCREVRADEERRRRDAN